MKKNIILYSFIALLSGTAGCSDMLDQYPLDAISPETYYNSGNHGMATAGSGDVLTGIIAGFLAGGLTPEEAAVFGVYVHGLSGDAMVEKTGYYSLMAEDILDGIKEVLK